MKSGDEIGFDYDPRGHLARAVVELPGTRQHSALHEVGGRDVMAHS